MQFRNRVLAGAAVLALAGGIITGTVTAAPARAAAACTGPAGITADQCIVMQPGDKTGQVIADEPGYGAFAAQPWTVTDYTGAAMAWVSVLGLMSAGEPVCSVSVAQATPFQPEICLGGPVSAVGSAENQPEVTIYKSPGKGPLSLTWADLQYLLAMKAAGLTGRDVAWLHKAETIWPKA
jgi:hypothetical protein